MCRFVDGNRPAALDAIHAADARDSNKLETMQLRIPESPMHTAPDFAGLLSALAAPARKQETTWNDEDLAADVATLSYENALRTHARYRATDRDLNHVAPDGLDGELSQAAVEPAETSENPVDKSRKSASITIRMSQAECDQLHRRAAEAGMTLSAYLRSCTLEAETLRAQVKQALAEMRKAGNEGTREQGNEQTKTLGSERASGQGCKSQGHRKSEEAMNQGAAESRGGRALLPIRKLGTLFLHRRSS